MKKKRKFREADYEATENTEIKLGEALPEDHLARFVVEVVKLLDLREIYAKYSDRGGMVSSPYLGVKVLKKPLRLLCGSLRNRFF